MFLEEHTWFDTGSVSFPAQVEAEKAQLRAMNVDRPAYFTTLCGLCSALGEKDWRRSQEWTAKVTVPTMNVIRFLAEDTVPRDWVILNVDIEGAEFHLVPCLAQFHNASLIDRIFLEERTWFDTGSATSPAQVEAAIAQLRAMNVDTLAYFTTLCEPCSALGE